MTDWDKAQRMADKKAKAEQRAKVKRAAEMKKQHQRDIVAARKKARAAAKKRWRGR